MPSDIEIALRFVKAKRNNEKDWREQIQKPEASKNIERVATPEFLALNSDLPLSFAYDMRNLLAHGYYKVDLEVVWKTIEADLPNLKVLVEKAIEGL